MRPTDLGAEVKSVLALAPVQFVAAGTGDGTAQNGPAIDRTGYQSAVLSVPAAATLAEGKKLTLAVKLQHNSVSTAEDAGWADFASADNLVLTGGTGGTTESGLVELDVNLAGAKQYVRAVITGDLDATATDTQRFGAVLTMGGASELPAA
jgi:hypothetical protein